MREGLACAEWGRGVIEGLRETVRRQERALAAQRAVVEAAKVVVTIRVGGVLTSDVDRLRQALLAMGAAMKGAT